MYVILCMQLNICLVVNLISRYQSNSEPTHWQACKRVMCHLHGIVDLVLCYQGEDLKMGGYSGAKDANWGDDLNESMSTSGYAFTLGEGVISQCR